MKNIFPNNTAIITAVYISILSAIVGTIHSMIWGSSNLLVLLIKKLKSKTAKNLIKSNIINARSAVLFVGAAIFTSYVTLKNMDLFFNLTAIFIVFALIMAMITLLTIKKEWQSGQNIKTLIGIGTAGTIFTFAVQGLLQAW